jgi:signal transduction histidine kinase/CheY-like chemotaxis protein
MRARDSLHCGAIVRVHGRLSSFSVHGWHLPVWFHLALLVVVTLVPVLAFSAGLVVRFAGQERAAVERGLIETARALATALDGELLSHVSALNTMASSERLERDDLRGFHLDAVRSIPGKPAWLSILLLAPEGRQTVNTRFSFGSRLPRIQDPDSVQTVLRTGRPVVGNIFRGTSGTLAFAVRVPVFRASELRYVLTAVVKPGEIASLRSWQNVSSDAVAAFVDRNGTIVARSRQDERYVGERATPDFLAQIRQGDEGRYRAVTVDGDPVRGAFARSRLSGWVVAIAVPARVVESPVWHSLLALGGVGGGVLLVSVGAALVLGRRIARRVKSASAAAQALAHGELPRLPPSTIMEIAELGAALESSAVLLRQREEDRRQLEAERDRLLRREQAARREAEAASQAKDEFLAMLGHELRNPAGAIMTAAAVLDRAGHRDDLAASTRAIIKRQAQHLARIIDDLLDVARVTTGKITLVPEPVDLADAATRCLGVLRDTGKLDHHVAALQTEPVWVGADPARLEQIITNLLVNAAKYTPAGGSINVRVTAEGTEAVLSVEDTGIGISDDLLPRVFELFTQGGRGLDRTEGGLGLGLALVRRLVEAHGGRVEAFSAGPGLGSRFVVSLPRIGATGQARSSVPVAVAPPGARRRVLIVEDNDDARETLRTLLELAGHEVHEAGDGHAGLAAALRLQPDVVLLDVGLPGLDGFEVARRVKAATTADPPRLVAITGYGQPEDRRRAQDAGFEAHLTKPVDPSALLQIVRAGRVARSLT